MTIDEYSSEYAMHGISLSPPDSLRSPVEEPHVPEDIWAAAIDDYGEDIVDRVVGQMMTHESVLRDLRERIADALLDALRRGGDPVCDVSSLLHDAMERVYTELRETIGEVWGR